MKMYRYKSILFGLVLFLLAVLLGCAAHRRPLGIAVINTDPEWAQAFDLWLDKSELHSTSGALVASVTPGGVADQAGMRRGDVIVEIDGHKVQNPQELADNLKRARGDKTHLVVDRQGQRQEFHVDVR